MCLIILKDEKLQSSVTCLNSVLMKKHFTEKSAGYLRDLAQTYYRAPEKRS